jgi:hypothetical protein
MASTPDSPVKKRPAAWTYLLLAAPYLALCFPQLYARTTPVVLGFPFFYWYQFVWVALTSLLLYIVYLQFKTPE